MDREVAETAWQVLKLRLPGKGARHKPEVLANSWRPLLLQQPHPPQVSDSKRSALTELELCWSPKIHVNMSILHSASKAQGKGDSRNHGLQDPHVYLPYTMYYMLFGIQIIQFMCSLGPYMRMPAMPSQGAGGS